MSLQSNIRSIPCLPFTPRGKLHHMRDQDLMGETESESLKTGTITVLRPDLATSFDAMILNRVQCKATRQDGDRCSKKAIAGGTVCRYHGGAAPQVLNAALHRIREARDMALTRLHESLIDPDEFLDPRMLLDVVTRLTDKVELLEGRATDRSESTHTEIREIRATIDAKLNDLAVRYERREMIL